MNATLTLEEVQAKGAALRATIVTDEELTAMLATLKAMRASEEV